MSIDKGGDFESWFCYELPWKLRLSPSKEVAIHIKFGKFADVVRPLVKKAPKEFNRFFEELKKGIEFVSNFRAPKGKKVVESFYKGKADTYPNKRPMHRLVDKW